MAVPRMDTSAEQLHEKCLGIIKGKEIEDGKVI